MVLVLEDTVTRILRLAEAHASAGEVDQLTGWLALRVGRSQALAGDRGPAGRLEHVVRYWLTAEQRADLASWMASRVAGGQSLVPDGYLPQG